MRTTIDIDASVLEELKTRSRAEQKPVGRLASELLAGALAERHERTPVPFKWFSKDMGIKVDLEDHDAVEAALDSDS